MDQFDDTDKRTANLLGVLVVAVGDALRGAAQAAAGHGGSGPAALVTAAQFPGETIGSLGQRVGLSQPAGVRLVDRLEAEGLAERGPGVDGRSVTVGVSAAGRERAEEILAARLRVLGGTLEALSADERDLLSGLLDKMLAHITVDVPHARLVCRLCDVPSCPQDRCPVTLGARNLPLPDRNAREGHTD